MALSTLTSLASGGQEDRRGRRKDNTEGVKRISGDKYQQNHVRRLAALRGDGDTTEKYEKTEKGGERCRG